MTLQGEYEPSPSEWVRDQVALYERTGGTEGNTMRDVPIVVFTSRGAKSGKLRKTPLMRVQHGGTYAAVASQGGAPEHPAWYHNFVADPRVDVQDGPEPMEYVAREITGEERATWWERATAVWPDYDDYQAKTEREIPVFVLEPVS
ncbi:nitroreductase family deazaflavin-dependent oxidoreductase [Nocardioides sp.]|uniref:nitroreductase family deazaflavin-dependent oxidoreductase n=1 Tax=Nocardioides sp. TaxID=35761 RepID=UPI002B269EF7|nr:nitroreductase family deazaflavin-dependent oxidoreductase [Nocardioides sp.]